jgi:hypothetical protein
MESLDTNILLDAADEDCREHDAAIRLVNEALRSPADWMLADRVLFEMDAGLRHSAVFAQPLSAKEAARRVAFLRDESEFSCCCYELRSWPATGIVAMNDSCSRAKKPPNPALAPEPGGRYIATVLQVTACDTIPSFLVEDRS